VTSSQRLATSCPTFSWSGVEGATGYELMVYRAGPDGELEQILRVEVQGDARGWTPSAAQCPDPGGRYAWAVRALGGRGDGEWSEVLLFETAGRPTEDEVRQALEVLRRYREIVEGPQPGEPQREVVDRTLGSSRRDQRTRTQRRPEDGVEGLGRLRSEASQGRALRSESVGSAISPQTVMPPAHFSRVFDGSIDLGGFIFKRGVPFVHDDGGDAYANTAVGLNALISAVPGVPYPNWGADHSALGNGALQYTTSGYSNTAVGAKALNKNVGGSRNTAVGARALTSNRTGFANVAVGQDSLRHALTVGSRNTALGYRALGYVQGSNNIAIGFDAGLTLAGSNSIVIGSTGGGTDTIRIGSPGTQTKSYIAGIRGASGGSFDQSVCTNGSHQLGPCSPSSLRFKRDVAAMGDTAELLRSLRPVTFRFIAEEREDGDETDEPLQYGLIAEEVAEVFPTLVSYDEEGEPYSVRYGLLTPLLLNELQRLEEEMADRDRQIADLRRRLDDLAKEKGFR
jgi:hypothetical protein